MHSIYNRAKCATLNKRQHYGEVMFRNDDECVNCIQDCPTSLFLKLFLTSLPIEFVSKKANQECPHIDKKIAYMLCLCNNV